MIATNEFQLQVARQTAKGAYPAAPTYALRVVSGGLSSKPTVDEKKVGDGSFWTTALKRTGYIETGGEPVLICDPNSLGLMVYGGMGTDTPAGGGDPYTHVITPSTTFGYFTFWQEIDDEWSVFHDCQIIGFELGGSTDDKFLANKPTIIGMAKEQKCAVPGALATAETDAYHWLDAGGYWSLTGDLTNMEHQDVPTDLAGLKTALTNFKATYNAHLAVATGRHHFAADAANTLAYATPPADLAACIVCLTEIRADLILHEARTATHYFADTTANNPSAAWIEPCVTLADCLIAIEDLLGYVNAPGCYNRHLGAMPGIKSFALTVGTNAKAIQGEGMTAYTIHSAGGKITIAAEQLMEDFRAYNLVKYGDPAAAAGTDVTSEIQKGSFAVKLTASVTGNERSCLISVPEFDWNPVPVMSIIGNPEGNEIYLPIEGEAAGSAPLATVTILNSIATY